MCIRDRGYRLGLYEKSMPAGLPWGEMLAAGKDAGFDQLEISIDESDARQARLDWTGKEKLRLLRIMAENDMPIATMCLSGHRKYPLGSHDPLIRSQGMAIMRKAIDLACDLGIRIIQLAGYDVYYENGDGDTHKFFLENLKKSVDHAAKRGVILGFETMETPFMDTISKGMAYVKKVQSPYLGMYPDQMCIRDSTLSFFIPPVAPRCLARTFFVANDCYRRGLSNSPLQFRHRWTPSTYTCGIFPSL